MWVWQRDDWPIFHYDVDHFIESANAFNRVAERLYGRVEALPEHYRADTLVDLMASEAITTSAIEGETLDRDSVRSSIKTYLGFAPASFASGDPKADGIAALMVDVRQHWRKPLTDSLLCGWQFSVIQDSPYHSTERGHYRFGEVEVVSGPIGRERVHYQAPPPSQVPGEVERFLDWYNTSSPISGTHTLFGPVRAGIAHVWFEMIHPFDDGNGRVGRAIADHALSQGLGFPTLACLATAIEQRRKDYYRMLDAIGRGNLDLNHWLGFFTDMANRAQDIAKQQIDFVLGKARFYNTYDKQLNERQAKVVARVFAEGIKGFEGGLTTKKYAIIAKCPNRTASRDLADMLKNGMIVQLVGGGRSTRYALVTPASSLDVGAGTD